MNMKRVDNEIEDHNKNVLENSYKLKNIFCHINTYPARIKIEEILTNEYRYLENKNVLDYGCGWGENSKVYASYGAKTVGIDITEKFINQANKNNKNKNLKFMIMDCHNLEFRDNTFDYIFGDGILHHLDFMQSINEIARCLKKGGKAFFFEPLGGHPLLKIFRLATPFARTREERPFFQSDLDSITKTLEKNFTVDYYCCGLLSAPIAIITSLFWRHNPDNLLLRFAEKIDLFFEQKKILRSWNQYCVIKIIKK